MTERPNIRRIQMPEASLSPRSPFDAAREVTPEMLNVLRDQLATAEPYNFATLALCVKVFSAESDPQLHTKEMDWRRMNQLLKDYRDEEEQRTSVSARRGDPPHQFALLATRMKMMDPSKPEIKSSDYMLIDTGGTWREAMEHQLAIKLLFPTQYSESTDVLDTALDGLKSIEINAPQWWVAHLLGAGTIRMLFPKHVMNVNQRHWDEIHTLLQQFWKQELYINFAHYATMARLLGAKDFTLDENGLQLPPLERPKHSEKVPQPPLNELGNNV